MLEIIGWTGSMLFALCAVPQAYKSWQDGHSSGLSWTFLIMWFLGEILSFAYIMHKNDVLPLIANYILNFTFLIVIIKYKLYPRKQTNS